MRMTAQDIAQCVSGALAVEPRDPQARITSLEWDSRKVLPGCLYVAFKGERVDGHKFVAGAFEAGALAALVSSEPDADMTDAARKAGGAIIKVADTQKAVTDLARAWRGSLQGRVIGLTGSVGKTTTKNLVRDVLASKMDVVATVKNQNNELGVPNTLLRANPETQAVVVEMGMRGRGQIEQLCEFVKPDWGLVTNVGDAHVELLGSRDNVARAKAELPAAIQAGGIAFLNAGNEYFDFIKQEAQLQERGVTCVPYDGTPEAEGRGWEDFEEAPVVWATNITLNDEGQPTFMLHVKNFEACYDGAESCAMMLRGVHNVSNACAAAAVGCALGMSLDEVRAALETALPEQGRQEVLTAASGLTVINDAYNANPDSMRAALTMFAAMAVEGKRVAVLGDMGELGVASESGHRLVGALAADLGIDKLVCVGPLARDIYDAACEAGMPEQDIIHLTSVDEALDFVQNVIGPKDAVLCKASHSMGLDKVAKGLVSE